MTQPITIKPATPEIKLFKPSEMARKTFVPSQLPPKPFEGVVEPKPPKVQQSSGATAVSPEKDKLFDRVVSGQKSPEVTATKGVGQMPILLENPSQEVKYIVGAQLGDLIVPPLDSPDLDNEGPASPEQPPPDLTEPESAAEKDAVPTERGSSPPARPTLIPKLANIEKIIPESDNSSNSDKSDSDSSSSSSQATSNSDWAGYNRKKKSKKNPEEITIEDDDEVNDRSMTTKYHAAFRGFLQQGRVAGSDSEGENNVPVVKKKRGRPAGKKTNKSKAAAVVDDDVTIFDPVQEEKEQKVKQRKEKQKKVDDDVS